MPPLPSPPTEDEKSLQLIPRRPSKPTKHSSRTSKRTGPSHEHGPVAIDGRHKRVWKACERCRMKKTKCDGESPCKRCKDDGLVCTAGSRKKTEFKQLPRGYAEVLENTQYALISTVQKLYTMVRNGEPWELGEPEMNERGQPVIHDIASKLGCIRPSPDLPFAFPEEEDDFLKLQATMQAKSDLTSEETGSRKPSTDDSSSSPSLDRADRASSTESDHSTMSKEYNQKLLSQRRNAAAKSTMARKSMPASILTNLSDLSRPTHDGETSWRSRTSIDTSHSFPSPAYTDYQTGSPMTASPFSWSGTDDFLSEHHILGYSAQMMQQQQQQMPRPSPLAHNFSMSQDNHKLTADDALPGVFGDGTVRPNMLYCNTGNTSDYDAMDLTSSDLYGGQIF